MPLDEDTTMAQEGEEEEREPEPGQEEHDDQQDMDEYRGDGDDDEDAIGGKRRLFRFKPAFDVVLVREVIHDFPWSAGYGRTRSAWMAVATRVQSTLETFKGVSFARIGALDHAIVKRRIDMLLEAFRKNELSALRGSGTPEEFDMRNKLLAILVRVVDEQTLNKGAMREKRVQSALEVALQNLAELEGAAGSITSPPVGLTSPNSAAPLNTSLMPIAPAPVSTASSRINPSLEPVSQNSTLQHQVQQNGNKRPWRMPSVPVSGSAHEGKRSRVDRTVDTISLFEERKLQLDERRVALEEEKLAWEKEKAQQDDTERQALLHVLRAQGSLLTELLAHLRNAEVPTGTDGLERKNLL